MNIIDKKNEYIWKQKIDKLSNAGSSICYQQSFHDIPKPKLQFKCGGTLRYYSEIYHVVTLCSKCTETEQQLPMITYSLEGLNQIYRKW